MGRCGVALDPLGHHQLTCHKGGFPTRRHNDVRNAFRDLARVAGLNARIEQGAFEQDLSRPADILVLGAFALGKAAAFDVTVLSPHVQTNMAVAGNNDVIQMAEARKHDENDAKCADLGCKCIPLAVDLYGQWGDEAHKSFQTLASPLAVTSRVSFAVALSSIYNVLGLTLARQNARALLARRAKPLAVGAREIFQLGRR